MRMRQLLFSGMIVLLLSAAAWAGETIYTIDGSRPTDQSANVYNNLEYLRKATEGLDGFTQIFLGVDDVILLHNNDNSLTLPFDEAVVLNIRSAGSGRYTIRNIGPDLPQFSLEGPSPALTVDSVHFLGTGGGSGAVLHIQNDIVSTIIPSGTAEFVNAVVESTDSGNGVNLFSLTGASFHNTQILGTDRSLWFDNEAGGGRVDISFDSRADTYNRWDGELQITGGAAVDMGVAGGKYFSTDFVTALDSSLTKTGGGTVKFGFGISSDLHVTGGTAQFDVNGGWVADSIHIGSGAVFKPSIHVGNWAEMASNPEAQPTGGYSQFVVNSFIADPGARLEIGNISTFWDLDNAHSAGVYALRMIVGGGNADSLRIDNGLMSARFVEINADNYADLNTQFDLPEAEQFDENYRGYYLLIDKVRNLGTLPGVGSYADAYRLNPNLSEIERDMLDSIYARGGTSGEDRGFLQTIGGSIIQNSLLAVRHTQANVLGNINRRLTSYQDEELATDILGISSSGAYGSQGYCEVDPENNYGEMWAYLDHNWMTQDDVAQLAGYEMSATSLGIGYDWHRDQWIYGGMLSYSTGDMSLASMSATKNDIETLSAAIYASWAENGWYLSGTGIATYGWNSATSTYTLPALALSSDADFATSGVGLNIETGYMMETEYCGVPLRVTPYGSLTYARHSRDSVDDTGARNGAVDLRKHFAAADWNTWDASLGVRVAVPMEFKGVTVVPSVDFAWTRITGERVPEEGVVYMYNNPGTSWGLDLMSTNRSSFRLIAGAEAMIKENMSLSANYELEWRRGYWNNRLGVNMSMDF